MTKEEFKNIVKTEFSKSEIDYFVKPNEDGYGVQVFASSEREIETMCDQLRKYGLKCIWWHTSYPSFDDEDENDDDSSFLIRAKPINEEKLIRKSIRESFDYNAFIDLFLDVFSTIFLFSQRKNIKKALGYKENESILKTLIMNIKEALDDMGDDSNIN